MIWELQKCYDRSLGIRRNTKVSDNKARMLSDWVGKLLDESKKLPFRMSMLEDAWDKNERSFRHLRVIVMKISPSTILKNGGSNLI